MRYKNNNNDNVDQGECYGWYSFTASECKSCQVCDGCKNKTMDKAIHQMQVEEHEKQLLK